MTYPVFRKGHPGLVPDAWIVNADPSASKPAVVAVHGYNRDVTHMASHLMRRAQQVGRTIVLPVFDCAYWRSYQKAAGRDRADLALLRLLEELRTEGLINAAPCDLSGFSGGGQFAHRFAWMHPDAVADLCIASPGWWTFPDARSAWPYGMSPVQGCKRPRGVWLSANLPRFLARRIHVCVGAEDVKRGITLRQSDDIDAQQGRTRVERATRWTDAMRHAACDLGIAPDLRLTVMEGCNHGFANCVVQGALDQLFIPEATVGSHALTDLNDIERTAA